MFAGNGFILNFQAGPSGLPGFQLILPRGENQTWAVPRSPESAGGENQVGEGGEYQGEGGISKGGEYQTTLTVSGLWAQEYAVFLGFQRVRPVRGGISKGVVISDHNS